MGLATDGAISAADGTSPANLTGQSAAKVWAFTTDDAITTSLNTSSSTDNGVGDYTISLANSFSSVNFATCMTVNENQNLILGDKTKAVGSYIVRVKNTSNAGVDANTGSLGMGDLA